METKFDYIRKKFTEISTKVEIDNTLKLYNINIRAEYIFMPILNDIYNYQLINANKIKANFPCIDLIDEKKRVVIQVTASLGTDKINKTLKCFEENQDFKKYLDYERLFFYIVKEKEARSENYLKKNNLSESNFLDIKDLLKEIEDDFELIDKLENTMKKIFTEENIQKIIEEEKPLYQKNKLWDIIEQDIDKTKQNNIELLLKNIILLLDTSPIKTIENIEILLDSSIEKLSSLEAIVLLISTYLNELVSESNEDVDYYLYDTDLILNKNNKFFNIQGVDIIDICSKIVLSQNCKADKLYEYKDLNSNDSKDDFLFCAILLKLTSLLNLENFIEDITYNYTNNILYFKCHPSNPNIENEIRNYLNSLEVKIREYNYTYNNLCHKWRDNFKLPSKVDLSGIKSSNYKFGNYKFSFDNNQVFNLLTGNNIYSNPMIFLRELLQNAIDASLYREAMERAKGNNFNCNPIEINDWYDDNGNYWIDFNDNGIGMDENILLNYFTKIGKSFYESKDFDKSVGFTAISRFGIGILSCFMVANRVEISTKKENENAIRFSINGLNSFFFTQIEGEHKIVKPFPTKDNNIHKYRKKIGTSIAMQIDFNKINRWFDIQKELLKHIYYSPIIIHYNNEKIGTTEKDLKRNPWIDEEIILELNNNDDRKIKLLFDLQDMEEKFNIKITPIDLSKYSPTSKIKAQMVLVEVITSIPKIEDGYKRYFEIDKESFVGGLMTLTATKQNNDNRKMINEKIDLSIYPVFKKFSSSNLVSKIGHNGIFVGQDFTNSFNSKLLNFTHNDIFSLVNISLYNEYRPSMSLSRSENISFDYQTISVSNLILSRFITQNNFTNKAFDCSLIYNRFNSSSLVPEIIDDLYLNEWRKEKIFLTTDNMYISLDEIQKRLQSSEIVQIFNYPKSGHLTVDYIGKEHSRGMFIEILIQLFTNGFIDKDGKFNIVKVFNNVKSLNELEYFSIGFFVHYDESFKNTLQLKYTHGYYALNYKHEFSKWLRNNAILLHGKYKGIFEDIKSIFSHSFRRDDELERLVTLLELIQKLEPNILDDEVIQSIQSDGNSFEIGNEI